MNVERQVRAGSCPTLKISRAANLWLGQHDDAALVRVRHRVAELLAINDRDRADVRLRIIVAIETWGYQATSADRPRWH